MGKGDKRRPALVSDEQVGERWAETFGRWWDDLGVVEGPLRAEGFRRRAWLWMMNGG